MNLGERIYQLRTAKNLSQEDLADALEVSRQSVSKWETGGSVPELDKLVKLCDMFEVTMDELVRGKAPRREAPPTPAAEAYQSAPIRVVVGLILLLGLLPLVLILSAILRGFRAGLILAVPLFVMGVLCLAVKRHTLLVCLWTLWGMTLILAPRVFGIGFFNVIVFVGLIALIVATVCAVKRRKKLETTL